MEIIFFVVVGYIVMTMLAVRPVGKSYMAGLPTESEARCHAESRSGRIKERWPTKEYCLRCDHEGCWRTDSIVHKREDKTLAILGYSALWPIFLTAVLARKYVLRVVPETAQEKQARIDQMQKEIERLESLTR